MTAIRFLIWLALAAAFLRGLFVFDMGVSAERTQPVASAICFVGSILRAVLMLWLERDTPGKG